MRGREANCDRQIALVSSASTGRALVEAGSATDQDRPVTGLYGHNHKFWGIQNGLTDRVRLALESIASVRLRGGGSAAGQTAGDTVSFISSAGASPGAVGSVTVTCRSVTNEEMEITPAAALEVLRSGDVAPWRDFRWRHGQTHYSGLYWSSTTGGHVAYESRLELARLLLADFDPQVGWVLSQPFLIEATVSGQTRRHVPDLALIDRHGLITIVNVKPPSRLGDAKVAATLAWAGVAFGLRGWRHEVWSGAPEVVLANVRFLAGYRRRNRFEGPLLDHALAAVAEPASIGGVEARCSAIGPPALIRPALLHLLWSGALLADLGHLLSGETILERAS